MDRRLFTFIVASTAFFFFYMTLRTLFVPPQVAKQDPDAAEMAEDPVDDAADPDDQPNETEKTALPSDDEAVTADPTPEPSRKSTPDWLTIGSMDESSGYFMLVTLSTRGGGVERIELTERKSDGGMKYRRVDVRSGYLGYFAGTAIDEGVLVNVVGPGTPADLAGVKAGDVIVAVAGQSVVSPDDIERALLRTRPGDSITVELRSATASIDSETPDGDESVVTTRGPPTQLTASLTEHPLDLVRLARDGGEDQIRGNLSRLSCLMTLSQVNRLAISSGERSIFGAMGDPAELMWSLTSDDDDEGAPASELQTAEFSLSLSDTDMESVGGKGLTLRRGYTLAPGSYAIDLSMEIENGPTPQRLAYRLEGANGITLEGWWYSNKISPNFSGAAARDIVYRTAADGHELISGYNLLKQAKKDTQSPDQNIFAGGEDDSRDLKYICVDAQYFTVGYVPANDESSLSEFRRASAGLVADPELIERHKERAVNCSFFLDSEIIDAAAGEKITKNVRLFAGPKRPELLAQYALGDCIYYGWFSAFAKILAGLLHMLSAVGNYAVAIIILTVIVRGGMFPLSRKAAVNAQRMQELAPELKKIADQYKDDMEGRLKAQRELQQRVGFNPLAGCLPMFLQLPIFIGLYRALSVDIELRGEAFASVTDWASNLAGPDRFYYWGDWLWDYLSGRGTGWLGPYFNILPVIVVVLFLAQQKMFMPPATDEQTAMTQKMMSIMTLMMGLFFFRVPAGLCIYFITSSLWGICERIIVKKTLPSKPHFDTSVIEGSAVPTEKSVSLAERIRQQVSPDEEPVERPNKRRRPPTKKKK